ncbi:BamA/TamA family outer membrane protein [Ponticoccus sp. SC2-23]|nr:BamA/TamA family outer membrane protein [Ponticoccus sp. SC6-9]MBM1226548.1 BamA/TamA family outer membrane protein [Ponticoccus sp. SC6-15]MBM1230499.1 BamA/TamA family outer membrane protein [Ponticoccus sp. SC6-38]MBM1235022.1 BamA/TamA family outer membrane protein [Ponticoccus sp. SC6-45]MBM1239520.1 BamA/TamA family outer membrane protein [Ponticoccus sp. SC6-49]MBM1243302.1 BamA/TamA family outer membrane protein [Ponticoccus sp. SC2-64]MBM1248546.1 BamA/TamA family outer membrane p
MLAGGIARAQNVELITPDASDDLRRALRSASVSLGRDGGDAQDFVAAARADYRRLLTALYSEGHYGGTISITIDGREAASIPPLEAPSRVSEVRIIVDPGPRYRFGRAEIGPVTSATLLPEAFAPGRIARTDAVRGAARAAIDGWRNEGHARADVARQDVAAIHPETQLDVAIEIDPGPRLTFGELVIEGNEDVRTERVREIAGYPQDRVFSPAEIEAATRRLQRTGTFDSVAFIESEDIGPGDTVPFRLLVDERLPRRIGAGLELSSVDGLNVSAYWLHRNLLGGAERFRIEGEASNVDAGADGIDYRIGATFARPATFKPDIDLETSATLSQINEDLYFLRQLDARLGLVQYIRDDLTYRAALGGLIAREETEDRTRDYALLTLPLEATLEQRDDPLDAKQGFFVNLEITPFAGITGLESGARILADGRAYLSFGAEDRVTLAARAQAGSVLGAGLTTAPADFLFYSGGGGTVRGQPYQSLSLTTQANFGDGPVEFESGGASFLGAQLEARVGVTDTIGVVGFYDIGLVGPEALPSTDDPLHAGAGIGLRYGSPIGPIRLDLATPATGDKAGERLEFYIGIGQAF